MGQEPRTSGSGVAETQDPQQIREQIDETRQEMGDTVEALTAKTDVKAQAKRKAQETKSSVAERKDALLDKARYASPDGATEVASQAAQKAREKAAGAFLAGLVIGRITKRQRKEIVLWPR